MIDTERVFSDTAEVRLMVRRGATCAQVLQQLMAVEERMKEKGAWQLREEWHGCSE